MGKEESKLILYSLPLEGGEGLGMGAYNFIN